MHMEQNFHYSDRVNKGTIIFHKHYATRELYGFSMWRDRGDIIRD